MATAIGAAGVDVDAPLGLDIAANDNDAFAVMTPAGDTQSGLYAINLSSGAATLIREMPVGERLRGLALLSRAVTHLLALERIAPSTTAGVNRPRAERRTGIGAAPRSSGITGLDDGEVMRRIAMRPATGELVGLTTTGRLLNINPRTGQTTFLSQVSVTLGGSRRVQVSIRPPISCASWRRRTEFERRSGYRRGHRGNRSPPHEPARRARMPPMARCTR